MKKKQYKKWEDYTNEKNDKFSKYEILSKDNPDLLIHNPNRMLLVLLHLKEPKNLNAKIKTISDYKNYYLRHIDDEGLIKFSEKITKESFQSKVVIVNDFVKFMDKVYHLIERKS